jgi:hypothetical protein
MDLLTCDPGTFIATYDMMKQTTAIWRKHRSENPNIVEWLRTLVVPDKMLSGSSTLKDFLAAGRMVSTRIEPTYRGTPYMVIPFNDQTSALWDALQREALA